MVRKTKSVYALGFYLQQSLTIEQSLPESFGSLPVHILCFVLQDKSVHPSVYERPPIKSPMVKRRKNGTTSSVKNVQVAVLGKDGVGKSGQSDKYI